MKAICETLDVSRSNVAEQLKPREIKCRGRRPLPSEGLLEEIRAVLQEMPTYGYRRVHAMVRKRLVSCGIPPPNHKRIYRLMKVNGLLLARHTGKDIRQHDGKVAVSVRNTRWCSDGFEIPCDNGERVRIAFSLDCCDREVISWIATTGGITSNHVQDLVFQSMEQRFGKTASVPAPIEWLTDNGSCYVARDSRTFIRLLGFEPKRTPIESPQSNGMAEAFVKTFKRDYVAVARRTDSSQVLSQLPRWFEHYNEVHPHKSLGYRSPREFIRLSLSNNP
jgi:putative transposase